MNAYGKLSTAFYDLDKPFAPADAIAFYRDRGRAADHPVLEPMCGSGRFLIPLLQAGVSVAGVDASRDMLDACRRRAQGLGLCPELYEQPLERLALPERYGMAFIPSGSLGLVHCETALRAGLRRLHQQLLPGAMLFIELVGSAYLESGDGDSGSRTVNDTASGSIRYDWRTTVDRSTASIRFDSTYTRFEGDEAVADESEQLVLKLREPDEMMFELALAGFSEPRLAPATDGMAWLRESGCVLCECIATHG